jgi:hypothetical protein
MRQALCVIKRTGLWLKDDMINLGAADITPTSGGGKRKNKTSIKKKIKYVRKTYTKRNTKHNINGINKKESKKNKKIKKKNIAKKSTNKTSRKNNHTSK